MHVSVGQLTGYLAGLTGGWNVRVWDRSHGEGYNVSSMMKVLVGSIILAPKGLLQLAWHPCAMHRIVVRRRSHAVWYSQVLYSPAAQPCRDGAAPETVIITPWGRTQADGLRIHRCFAPV